MNSEIAIIGYVIGLIGVLAASLIGLFGLGLKGQTKGIRVDLQGVTASMREVIAELRDDRTSKEKTIFALTQQAESIASLVHMVQEGKLRDVDNSRDLDLILEAQKRTGDLVVKLSSDMHEAKYTLRTIMERK